MGSEQKFRCYRTNSEMTGEIFCLTPTSPDLTPSKLTTERLLDFLVDQARMLDSLGVGLSMLMIAP